MLERHRDKASTELGRFELDLTAWIASQPCLMSMRIQPVDLKTGTILLAAPAAATLYVENVHIGLVALARADTAYAVAPRFSRM